MRGRRIAVLGTSPMGVHQAMVFSQLSDRVTLLTHTTTYPEEAREQLAAVGVQVVDGTVAALRSETGDLRAVVLDDGREVPVDAVVVTPRYLARGELYTQLGGTLTFQPTKNWAVSWGTDYSITTGEFSTHRINLKRDLYRWQANFDYILAPNGNTAFSFSVHLIDLPDLNETGLIGRTYDQAEARPRVGFFVETLGATLALLGAIGTLVLRPRGR